MSKKLTQLVAQVMEALTDFQKMKPIILEAQEHFGQSEPTTYDLYAVGGILHSLYNGMEHIMSMIVKTVDPQGMPVGDRWHIELLEKSSQDKIIQPETKTKMNQYRGFRHAFRNSYGFELDWVRLKPLLNEASDMVEQFSTDIVQFVAFLEMMSDSDT